jgi:hypothetical protein
MEIKWIPTRSYYPGGPKKTGICIHHQAGMTKDLSGIFNSRQVSAHYSVGDDYVYQYVAESDRGWHTGETHGNTYDIGIETLNSSGEPAWDVSARTVDNLCGLLAEIAQNQGWSQLHHDPHRAGVGYVYGHKDVQATACPGPTLYKLIPSIVNRANEILNPPEPAAPPDPARSIQLYYGNATKAQLFKAILAEEGWYYLKCAANGLALDAKNAGNTPGTPLRLYPANNTDAQKFAISGKNLICKCAPGLVADCVNGGTSPGTGIQLYTENGTPAQEFQLINVSGYRALLNPPSMLFVDAVNGGK